MLKTTFILALPILVLAATTCRADANVQTFSNPNVENTAISACLADGTTCGKPAADAYCQLEGFRESILFKRKKVKEAVILDSGNICTSGVCDSFASIKCHGEAAASTTTGSVAP